MIQAFSLIFNFFNIASPCGDMLNKFYKLPKKLFLKAFNFFHRKVINVT
jgi:hypothetical protein